jgi:CBS domain-containing protein
LADIIVKLAANRIHRIYVVDAVNAPVAVISLGDILAIVAEAAGITPASPK